MSTFGDYSTGCETLSPFTLATAIFTFLATLFLTYFKGKKQFCGKEERQPEFKLSRKQRNRLAKIHVNLETLLKNQGLEVASIS